MALINCPECKKEISDEALRCPHCGKTKAFNYWDGKSWPVGFRVFIGLLGLGMLLFTLYNAGVFR